MSNLIQWSKSCTAFHPEDFNKLKELGELAEQLQARMVELEQDNDAQHNLIMRQSEILTTTANALKGGPEGLSLHSHHDLMDVAHKLVCERDALAATVERLRDALSSVEEYANGKCFEPAAVTFSRVREALKATPQQNLAEHDAEVARKAFIEGSESLECAQMFGRDYDVEQAANEYAERAKRGES